MAAILADGELTLSGDVGDAWFGDSFTYSEVVILLAQIDDDAELTVRLNSGGGIATEGAAIHALLARRGGRTVVVVEGIAASAASLIAMAGETVTMAEGSIMMIHDPSGITFGTSDDHAKSIEGLEALATAYARVYAAKSGLTADQCREIMKRETWLTAAEAVAQGFADDAGDDKAGAVAAFDYRIYAHAPKRLTALAKKNGWSHEAASSPAAKSADTNRQQEENSMTEKERADALAAELEQMKTSHATALAKAAADAIAADRARRTAVMALDEAKGREALADTLVATQLSVEDIKAALVVAPKASEADQKAYEQQRLTAAGLSLPGGQKPAEASVAGWAKAAERINKRNG
ncbi:Clp protease ClpP [Mesorhizobium sp. M5C.F.Ca.IN.020.14.1.1]|nr:Clp protease ClpP [Mesorhizobium sp. M5C.F.Ca.IN.020.14.1.1]